MEFSSTLSNVVQEKTKGSKFNQSNKSCPEGMVPIPIRWNGAENIHPHTVQHPGQHFATIETMLDGSIYRGAGANISIHNLTLQDNQYSKAQIWLEDGSPNELNSIQFGSMVSPKLYGDNLPHFTIYWMVSDLSPSLLFLDLADSYRKTGCYNIMCPGFIQLDRCRLPGLVFSHISIFGKITASADLHVAQDLSTGNWILRNSGVVIGYWPKELLPHLNRGASLVRYGGNTFASQNGISPPMGNGHFPVIDYQKSANFVDVKIVKANDQNGDIEDRKMRRYADAYQCYRLIYWGYNGKTNRKAFSYGGPSGKCVL